MDLYTAFMRAADRIETNPPCFDMGSIPVPESASDKGCVLGWVAYEMGTDFTKSLIKTKGGALRHADGVLKHLEHLEIGHFGAFYQRMNELYTKMPKDHSYPTVWSDDSEITAKVTRIFAQTYLKPAEKAVDPELSQVLKSFDKIFAELA